MSCQAQTRSPRAITPYTINALGNHGLDRCPDHGIAGFERYADLAVLDRNLKIFGAILQKRAIMKLKRQERKTTEFTV
jgi:transposase, IS5 family